MIIVICGTVGSGKGAITKYLISKGFKHHSARKYIAERLKGRDVVPDRNNLINMGDELRKISPTYLIEKLIEMAQEAGGDCVIESVRTIAEINAVKKFKDSYSLGINADIKKRYERIKGRGAETDKISFEQFVTDDEREWINPDPDKVNIRACMEIADFKIENNKSLQELYDKLDEILEKIKSK